MSKCAKCKALQEELERTKKDREEARNMLRMFLKQWVPSYLEVVREQREQEKPDEQA